MHKLIAADQKIESVLETLLNVGWIKKLQNSFIKAVGNQSITDLKAILKRLDTNFLNSRFNKTVKAIFPQSTLTLKEFILNYVRNDKQYTALMIASFNGNNDMVQLLAKHGADINAKDGHDNTALSFAADSGYKEVVDTILKLDPASVNFTNKIRYTALLCAVTGNGDQDTKSHMVKALLKHGADPTILKKGDECALSHAAKQGNLSIMTDLLDYGANINNQSQSGHSPLIFAVIWGQLDAVKLLIERGADKNLQIRINQTEPDTTGFDYESTSTLSTQLDDEQSIDTLSQISELSSDESIKEEQIIEISNYLIQSGVTLGINIPEPATSLCNVHIGMHRREVNQLFSLGNKRHRDQFLYIENPHSLKITFEDDVVDFIEASEYSQTSEESIWIQALFSLPFDFLKIHLKNLDHGIIDTDEDQITSNKFRIALWTNKQHTEPPYTIAVFKEGYYSETE